MRAASSHALILRNPDASLPLVDQLEGKIATCPRHGSKFDISTGKSISGPKIGFLKLKTKKEPSYEIKIEGDKIKVKI